MGTPIFSALFIGSCTDNLVSPATAVTNSPRVTPATGGRGVPITIGSFDNVAAIGYETAEFFIAGEAHSYTTTEGLTQNGNWGSITTSPTTAAYKTRAVVYTPRDKNTFNDTVYIEWQNVSGLVEAAPDWVHGHIEVARQGAVYVLASVQSIGIITLKSEAPFWVPDVPFPVSDPERYASLDHPGDIYSYDIFSQLGQAAMGGQLTPGLVPQRVIGLGESQSAMWLTTYINLVQPVVDVYDGFIVHSSFVPGAQTSQSSQERIHAGPTKMRDDLVPVLLFQSETDVAFGRLLTRQPESPNGNFRLWEVAGTAHYDSYGLEIGINDTGSGEGEILNVEKMRNPSIEPQAGIISCAEGINAGPMHWVYNAALNWVNRWVKDGTPPPIAPQLETESLPGFRVVFKTDEHGNTLGGIRTPFVDVPIATLTGSDNKAAEGAPLFSFFCGLFGKTVPLSTEKLAELYPSHDDFVWKYRSATFEAVESGYLLLEDAVNLIDAAEESIIGKE